VLLTASAFNPVGQYASSPVTKNLSFLS